MVRTGGGVTTTRLKEPRGRHVTGGWTSHAGSPNALVAHARPWPKAYAVAAVRDETSSLVKMLDRWRATVFSLKTSSAAIWALLRPLATSLTTPPSRALRPAGKDAGASSSATSSAAGPAPTRRK